MRQIPLTVYLVVAFVTLVANFFIVQRRLARQAGASLDSAQTLFGAVGVAVFLLIPVFYHLYITLAGPLFEPVLIILQRLLTYGWAHLAAYAVGAGRHWLERYLPGLTFLLTIPLLFLFVRITAGLFPHKWWTLSTWLLFFGGLWPWLQAQRRRQAA